MDKAKLNPKAIRKFVQAGWGVLTNAYIQGFLPGGPPIYQGKLKNVCVPGMNCYSCPGALGACPIGAMQVDETACINCGKCARTCKMNVNPKLHPNSNECIRCRECVHACPVHALSMGIPGKRAKAKIQENQSGLDAS